MSSFLFKELNIIHIVNKNLKNSYIQISRELEITLKTPKVSDLFVSNLLQKKESWIRKKILTLQEQQPIQVNIEDEVLLFGEVLSIDMPEVLNLRLKLSKNKNSSEKSVLKHYNSFYSTCAKEYVTPRVVYFAQIMNLDYEEIKFRKMKSRWGSCSSKKVLTFNTELIKTKKELIDYVVVHELAHLKHMNHSKKFHDYVEEYLPNSKSYRAELKSIHIAT